MVYSTTFLLVILENIFVSDAGRSAGSRPSPVSAW